MNQTRRLTRAQKWLLFWSVVFIAAAFIVKQVPVAHSATVGLIEVLLAAATGICFGVTVARSERSSD